MSREKQIEEMATKIQHVTASVYTDAKDCAEALYNAGYRKQSEDGLMLTFDGATGYFPKEFIIDAIKAYQKQSEGIANNATTTGEWISVDERLPETDNENKHTFNVLVYIPEREGCRQHGMYLGKIRRVKASDGKDNFWNIPTQESEWTVWGWSYFEHPVVTHWMPLPEAPKMKGGAE